MNRTNLYMLAPESPWIVACVRYQPFVTKKCEREVVEEIVQEALYGCEGDILHVTVAGLRGHGGTGFLREGIHPRIVWHTRGVVS